MTYLLETFSFNVQRYPKFSSSPLQIAFIYRYLPVRAKNGIASLPGIFELSVHGYSINWFKFKLWGSLAWLKLYLSSYTAIRPHGHSRQILPSNCI